MNISNKLKVLNLIYENKDLLFGRFSNNVTHEIKVQRWKEITDELIERDIFEKDWKYLRDTTWQNWRKRSVEKRANSLKTGKQCKYDAADELVYKIVDKDPTQPSSSDEVDQQDPLETAGTSADYADQATMRIEVESPRDAPVEFPQINATQIPRPRKRLLAVNNDDDVKGLRKQRMEVELQLANVKLEIAKRERYKLDLELLKLERELNITRHSTFTLPIVMQSDCKFVPTLDEN